MGTHYWPRTYGEGINADDCLNIFPYFVMYFNGKLAGIVFHQPTSYITERYVVVTEYPYDVLSAPYNKVSKIRIEIEL